MKRSVNALLLAASALVIFAVIAILVISIRQTQRVQDTSDMVAHTHDVMLQTERLLSLALDNVTIARGYLLTGNGALKDSLDSNKKMIREELANLQEFVVNNPIQKARVSMLQEILQNRINRSDSLVMLRDRGNQKGAVEVVASGKGFLFLDSIRTRIGQMQREEKDLLLLRRSANEKAVDRLNDILIAILGIVLLLLLILSIQFRQEWTQRKAVEAQDQYLAQLVNQVPDAIISADPDRKIQSWNPGAEQLFGWKAAEVMGRNLYDLLAPRFESTSEGLIIATLNNKGTWVGEIIAHDKQGKELDVWLSASRILDHNDKMIGTVTIARDLRDKKALEKKLLLYNQELEEEVRGKTEEIKDIYERVRDGFLAFDRQCRYVYLNQTAADILQCQPADLIGKKPWEVFADDSVKELPALFEAVLKEQKERVVEQYSTRLRKWFEMKFSPSARGLTVFLRDIDARKKAEQALRESEERYQILIEQAGDGIFVSDSEGNYLGVNNAACEMTGYSREELLTMNLRDLVPASLGANRELKLDQLNTGIAQLTERIMRHKSGGLFDVEISAKRLSDGRLQAIVRNITERKKSAAELEESEAKFKGLVEQSLVGVYIIQDGKFVYVNPQMAAMHGYSADEMLQFPSVIDLVAEDEKVRVEENLFRRIEGEVTSLNYEFSIRKKNGEQAKVEVFGSRTFFRGRPAIIGTAIDNTERKRAEREVSLSNERFQLISKATNDAMWDWDLRNNRLWWNEKHYQLYGHDPAHPPLDFESWQSKIHPDEREEVVSSLNYALSSGKAYWEQEYRFMMPSGNYGHIFDRVHIVYDGGQPVRLLGSAMDITERIVAEEQLKESEQKYKLLFENNPMPMWMLSLPERRFLDVNEAAVRKYGYSREEFRELNVYDIRPDGEKERFADYVQTRQTGEGQMGVWRHMLKNGTIIDVEIFSHEIIYKGQPALLILSVDVTEKLKYEARIRQTNEELRQLSAHLQDVREEERMNIAREIHDELGQLITVMKMDVSWLNRKLDPAQDAVRKKIKELLELLDKTVQTVRRIATELRPSILDDLGLAAAMEWQGEEFARKSGIRLIMDLHPMELNLPASVGISLFRIFQESLTNVARHSQATEVHVSLEIRKGDLVLSVQDNGRGFDESQIGSKKTLGLLGMQERTIMTGGRFKLTSNPGAGTRVEISVPEEVWFQATS